MNTNLDDKIFLGSAWIHKGVYWYVHQIHENNNVTLIRNATKLSGPFYWTVDREFFTDDFTNRSTVDEKIKNMELPVIGSTWIHKYNFRKTLDSVWIVKEIDIVHNDIILQDINKKHTISRSFELWLDNFIPYTDKDLFSGKCDDIKLPIAESHFPLNKSVIDVIKQTVVNCPETLNREALKIALLAHREVYYIPRGDELPIEHVSLICKAIEAHVMKQPVESGWQGACKEYDRALESFKAKLSLGRKIKNSQS